MATSLQKYCLAVPSVVLKETIFIQQIILIASSLDPKRRKLGQTRAVVLLPPGGKNWQLAFKSTATKYNDMAIISGQSLWKKTSQIQEKKGKQNYRKVGPTTPSIPRRSPIQVLTWPNVA